MALVVEDGSVVSGANSYVTLTEFKTWADNRGIDYGTDYVLEQKILRAMDFLERQPFIGEKANEEQLLQWPRVEAVIDGYYVDATEVPTEVKKALYEATVVEIQGYSELNTQDRRTVMEKIGDITVQYASNSDNRTITPALTFALSKIVNSAYLVSRT
jgi:hypothetical protein